MKLPSSTSPNIMEEFQEACRDNADDADFQLMQRLAQGDQTALETLVDQFSDRLSLLIGRLTAWSTDREDLLQDVFLLAWQRASQFQSRGSLAGWMTQLAINRCRKYFRAKRSFLNFLERLTYRQPDPTTPMKKADPTDELSQALEKLKPEDRTVLVLFYLEEMPGAQVAEILGISNNTLHVRLHRARLQLKKFLDEEILHER